MPIVSGSKRFFIGGVGGLAPVFALLVAVDFEKNLVDTSTAQVLGYMVRALALFAIGGFIAWLHETEDKPFKLFEIGLGAPALIAGLITAKSISPESPQRSAAAQPNHAVSMLFAMKSAIAQTSATESAPSSPTRTEPKSFTVPVQQGTAGFLEGLLGTRPSNVYYVIVGSHTKLEDAEKQANRINATDKQFTAQVYAPYGGSPYYAVVIGANMTKADANALRARAAQAGLPQDTYLWTFPSFR